MKVRIARLPHGRQLPLPTTATEASAGIDLRAALETPLTLAPGSRALVPTGLALEIPAGSEGQIRPRSGLALRHGVTVLNSPGTIDSDYRGEVQILLVNHGDAPFTLQPGMRVAQLVFARLEPVTWDSVESLTPSDRGSGGFGSTGVG